ncbi:hypothetical protein GCM10009430_05700 [Aquimarina litoralis]|uniref:Grasp-with-spasm system SPASM domain peptide maturase n=1 Tax=Aquimarina litoralis TaxID=584605 RepID=A0ABP3TRZ6_9FLAO
MKVEQETPFKLIANCIPVKGAKRSSICDLHRGSIQLIPNDLYKLIKEHEGNTIVEIKKKYDHKYDTIIDEYFEFLIDHEFVFFTTTPELFPKMSMNWYQPNTITNAIIDVGKQSDYDIHQALENLNELRCKHIEFRFFKKISLKEIKTIVAFLDDIKSSIISIDFTIPFDNNFKIETAQDFMYTYARVSSFRYYGSHENKFIAPIDNRRGYIIITDTIINNEKCCGVIDSSLFSVNINTFTESQQFNSCLNRKISIDTNGHIKNCPSMMKSYGSIKAISLNEVVEQKEFKKYWNISKDKINVCKDCEFRHVCTDCRAYIEDPENLYSKPLKCGYDPYTNTWQDWSQNPLKKKTIKHYELIG